jgi:putative heme-binding domain-containing protein
LTPTLHAQRDAKVPDPDPELERRSFQVADGFEVNLFAADPLLAKPIQMNFDARGRLWLACSEVYPQIKPGQKANDKIIVLEDTDGDGRADRTTVFADGLLIPTGVEPGDGGAYVADSTDLLHLADTKGTGKADRRRVVLSGFGTEDTHHILHTLRWGPDGMLYFNQSIYIHSHIETPFGVRRLNAGGVWQFRPETMRLEVFLRGFCNPWGHHFDRWGQSFVTDGAYGEGVNYGLPGASYVFAQPATRILAGLNPGSPKHCGAEIVSGRHLPESWQGNILTNDFRGHRVCRFVLSEDGAGYASREQPEVIKTNHGAFRPIDIKMGPDGAIYIADWYNPIIQHGEVDFRDPRRDLSHGRIWRVTAKGRPLVPRPRLADASTAELLNALKAPEDWTRHFAKRTLKERGKGVVPELEAWMAKLTAADPDYEHHLLEALWTYQSLDVVEPGLVIGLLQAGDPRARAAAARVLLHWHDRLPNAMDWLEKLVADEHPRVRLEAVRALGQIPGTRSAELAMRALDRPVDKFLDYALWLTARELAPSWLTAVKQKQFDFGGHLGHLVFALQAVATPEVVRPLVDLVRAGKVPADRAEGVLTLIANLGGPPELALILDSVVTADRAAVAQRVHLLNALIQATGRQHVRPAGDLSRLSKLLTDEDESLRSAAVRAAGMWKIEPLRPKLLEYARSDQISPALRKATLEGLVLLGGPASRETLEELAQATHPAPVRQMAVVALTSLDPRAATAPALAVLASGGDAGEVFTAFLQHKNGATLLARALADNSLPPDVAKAGIRTVRASGRDHPELVQALTKAGKLTTGPRTLNPEEMQQLVADVAQHGNAARGEAIFRRSDQQCLKCHAIAGAGGQVGPDLASIGASAPVDYLVDSLLMPNKAIKENYHSVVVTTREGRVFAGIPVRQTDRELVLRDAEDKEIPIPLDRIEEKTPGASLMPDGLTDPLTRGELIDLVRFLSELGKVGPYAPGNARVVRRWQALEPTREAYQLLTRTSYTSAAGSEPSLTWVPAYSRVAGDLPLEGLPRLAIRKPVSEDKDVTTFVRCQLEVTSGGKIRLRLNSVKGLLLWLDGAPVTAKEETVVDVAPGLRTLTFAIDLNQRREGLRSELDDAPGSAARVRIIGGK